MRRKKHAVTVESRLAALRGHGTSVTVEAIRAWSQVPPILRFQWMEEMIRLEAALPRRVREAHRKFREAEI